MQIYLLTSTGNWQRKLANDIGQQKVTIMQQGWQHKSIPQTHTNTHFVATGGKQITDCSFKFSSIATKILMQIRIDCLQLQQSFQCG